MKKENGRHGAIYAFPEQNHIIAFNNLKNWYFSKKTPVPASPKSFFFQLGVFVAVTGNKLFIKIGAIYAFPEQNHSQSQDQWQLIRF